MGRDSLRNIPKLYDFTSTNERYHVHIALVLFNASTTNNKNKSDEGLGDDDDLRPLEEVESAVDEASKTKEVGKATVLRIQWLVGRGSAAIR
jgi:hypothetical protein